MKEEIINYLSSLGWNCSENSASKTVQGTQRTVYINGQQTQIPQKSLTIKIIHEGDCTIEDQSKIEVMTEWSIHENDNDLIWITASSLEDFKEQINELLR